MERRIRVWLITLVVLLLAALFSTVIFKLQLDESRELLDTSELLHQNMSVELAELTMQMETDEAEAVATIAYLESAVADYEDKVEGLESDIEEKDEYIAGLEAAKTAEEDIAAMTEENERLRTELDAAVVRVEELETELSVAIEDADEAGDSESGDELAEALAEAGKLRTKLAEVEAQLEDAESDCEELSAELEEVNARVAELETELEEAKAAQESDAELLAELETGLEEATAAAEAAQVRADELEEQLAIAQETVNDELASGLETELEETEALLETANAELETANTELETANAELETAAAELEAANAELEAARAELEMYRSAHSDSAEEKHASAELDGVVNVQGDGVTAGYAFANNNASGNSVIFSLIVDESAVYTSGIIAPGEGFEGFELESALPAGEYEAVVCVSTLNADGDVVSNMRLPVAVCVAE